MISNAITQELIVHTAVGGLGLPQITEAMKSWYDHPDFDPSLPVLWDLRDAVVQLPDSNSGASGHSDGPEASDLKTWSEHNRELINELRAGQKTAWVFGNDRDAELAVDLLGAFDWQHRVRIFNNDFEAARAWLTSTIR